jgi:hypothetical protein
VIPRGYGDLVAAVAFACCTFALALIVAFGGAR